MKDMISSRTLIPFLIFLISFLLFEATAQYGLSYTDEGFFLESIHRIVDGQIPFRDFYCSYFPGRYYIGAAIVYCFGDDLLTLRRVLCLLWALLPTLSYLISLRIVGPGYAFMPAILFCVLPGAYYNRFYPLAVLLNMWIMLKYIEKPLLPASLCAGVITGITIWLRQDIGLCGLAIALVMIVLVGSQRIKGAHSGLKRLVLNYSAFFAGLIIFLLPLFIGILVDRAFREGLAVTLDFAFRAYYEMWLLPYPEFFSLFIAAGWKQYGFWELFQRSLYHLPIFTLFTHTGLILFYMLKGKSWTLASETSRQEIIYHILVLCWQVSAIYYVSLRTSFNHLLISAAAWYIGWSYIVSRLGGGKRGGKSLIAFIRLIGAGFLLVLYVLMIIFACEKGDFYTGSPGVIKQDMVEANISRVNVKLDEGLGQQLRTIVHIIQARTGPDDYFMTLPCFSLLNFACVRKSPSYFLWVTPDVVKPGVEQRVISEINDKAPPYLIFTDLTIDEMESRRFSRYAPKLNAYLETHYFPQHEIEAPGWDFSLTLLKRESGIIGLRFDHLLQRGNKNSINVVGALRLMNLDLGHGRIPYLLFSPGSRAHFTVPLPEMSQILFKCLTPEILIMSSPLSTKLTMELSCTSEGSPTDRREIGWTCASQQGVNKFPVKEFSLDLSHFAGRECIFTFTVSQKQSAKEDMAGLHVALGYPRLVLANEK
ncbi:ArnT family glycosyltransferase [candidate division CSSED10-310 bacterium]|uniref:ArnT family glycosyltransferase n=1 Tax=candidate division CSSED10-310 bacterium TaxID=2855610 RepID=A0ABV6YTC9_UNCC1